MQGRDQAEFCPAVCFHICPDSRPSWALSGSNTLWSSRNKSVNKQGALESSRCLQEMRRQQWR